MQRRSIRGVALVLKRATTKARATVIHMNNGIGKSLPDELLDFINEYPKIDEVCNYGFGKKGSFPLHHVE